LTPAEWARLPWQRWTFDIAVRATEWASGAEVAVRRNVLGYRRHPFGIHRRDDGSWSLTHLLTGRAIFTGKRMYACKRMAALLVHDTQGPNAWEFRSVEASDPVVVAAGRKRGLVEVGA
jgi:hypothetical protein